VVWAATSPLLNGIGGVYCEDCDVARIGREGTEAPGGVRPWAIDPETAESLWAMTESLTGLELPTTFVFPDSGANQVLPVNRRDRRIYWT
jgi:hypothetical protein